MAIFKFSKNIYFDSYSAVGGYEENRGQLAHGFDFFDESDKFGQKTWELSEAEMSRTALNIALSKAEKSHKDISLLIGGDLQNQCVATSLGLSSFGIPYFGVYGACSTCTESIAMVSAFLNTLPDGSFAGAVTSSHNSAAERQFRTPIEYGAQRNKSAQWTATAAGAFILGVGDNSEKPRIVEAMAGRIIDGATKDAANMGGAMAFSAADTIISYFEQSSYTPADFDFIVTGDLGKVGSAVLCDILGEKLPSAKSRHTDCGLLLYNEDVQDVHSGASGCGTSAAALAAHFLPLLESRQIKRILLLSTGALMSPSSVLQGQNIFGVAPLVHIEIPDIQCTNHSENKKAESFGFETRFF